jgi:hypothetical protein
MKTMILQLPKLSSTWQNGNADSLVRWWRDLDSFNDLHLDNTTEPRVLFFPELIYMSGNPLRGLPPHGGAKAMTDRVRHSETIAFHILNDQRLLV